MPMLSTPFSDLHYQLRGSGQLLVISQSGEGDADRTRDLVDCLATDFTVLTYDRRGLSRSRLRAQVPPASMADHAEDLHHLLTHLADGPAPMLGCSLGAVIGLHLAVRHPEQLGVLVAHEPIAAWLLPPDSARQHREELTDIQELYCRDGLGAALPAIVRTLGIEPSTEEKEPGLATFPMDDRRLANFDHFIRHDFTAAIQDDLDPSALTASPVRIIPAAGATTPPGVYDRRCATALSELLERSLVTFPGGHNGNLSHPRSYAEQLRQTLRDNPAPVA